MTNRINWVDWVKAICIGCVVLGHTNTPEWRPFIYGFHMPLFFAISGFLYKPHHCMFTLLGFLVPVAVFSLLKVIAFVPFEVIRDGVPLSDYLSGITWLTYRFSQGSALFTGVWFLEVLFVIRIVMGDIPFLAFLRKYHLPLSLLCIALSVYIQLNGVEMDLYISRIIQCFPFFSAGLMLREHDQWRRALAGIRPLLLLSLFGLHICLSYTIGNCDISENHYGMSYLLFCSNALIGSVALIALCNKLKGNGFVRQCSIGTLVILGIHTIIIRYVWSVFGIPYLCPLVSLGLSMAVGALITRYAIEYCPAIVGKIKIKI